MTKLSKAYALFRHGFLVRVHLEEKWVAAALCERRTTCLRLCELGILNGDVTLLRKGISAAVYIGVMREAHERGFPRLSLTNTSPICTDGLFMHKRNWGTTVSLPVDVPHRVALYVNRYTPAVRQFFAGTPMIGLGPGRRLHGILPLDSLANWTADEAARWRKHFAVPGLASLKILPLDRLKETGQLSLVTVGNL